MAQPPTLNTERLQFLHLVSASRATLKTTRPARLCPELLEVGVRLREEGWRGREDPRTRGEDERVSGGRKSSSGVWLETQKVIRMELSSPIRVRWLLEQQTPPKSCFNPGRSLLPSGQPGGLLSSTESLGDQGPCPALRPRPPRSAGREGTQSGTWWGGALPDQSWKRHPYLTSLRYILRTKFAHFRCTIQRF